MEKEKEIERELREYCKVTDCRQCRREESNEHPCFTIALRLGDCHNDKEHK